MIVGRFAPTPSGPLHFGSLVAAVASYLDARSRGGKWLVRVEDIDTPRVVPGSAENILDTLKRGGHVFPCSCSRTAEGPCRCTSGSRWRVRFPGEDFTVLRADGIFAYHLAVVVDDAYQGVTDVVRGADLLDSTPQQMHLQKLLGLPTPRYVHVPVVTNENGEKLSKQNLAPPLDVNRAPELSREALRFLGQCVPGGGDLESIWRSAINDFEDAQWRN